MARGGTLALAALVCPLTGCLSVYSTRPVDVVVTRTDTGQPAAEVPVRVGYGSKVTLNPPTSAEGTTDAAGRVTLPIADFESGLTMLSADGTRYDIAPDIVRAGGPLTYKSSAHPDEPVPTYSVRIVTREKSLRTLLLDLMRHKECAPADHK
jgi:hypothetical protein